MEWQAGLSRGVMTESTEYDSYAAIYDAVFSTAQVDLPFWSAITAEQHIAEIGCGSGRVTHHIARSAKSVVGIDPSRRMLDVALSKGQPDGVRFELGRAEALPLPSGSVGMAISPKGAFAHLLSAERRLQAIHEVARVLRPGGQAVIDVPHFPPTHALADGQAVQIPSSRIEHGGKAYVCRSVCQADPLTRVVSFNHIITRRGYWFGSRRTFNISLNTYMYTPGEIEHAMAVADMSVQGIYGDYE